MKRTTAASVLPSLLLPLAACGTEGIGAAAGTWEAVTDTVGDTVVVRTVRGSVWGEDARLVPEVSIGVLEGDAPYMFGRISSLDVGPGGAIYAVDAQVPELRVFEPDGTWRAALGRPGEGPGELKRPDGGLAILSDGRVLVRDPGNGRIQVYSGETGEALATWPLRGNFSTSNPLWRDRSDRVYTQILLDPEADIRDWRMGLAVIASDGSPVDTLAVPDADYEPPTLEARREEGESRSVSRTGVPFSPSESWVLHPDGYFVHGVSTDYAFKLLRADRPLRVERVYEPVPVTSGEKDEETARVSRNMRSTQPNWRWNGPPIPDVKPPFRGLRVGRDGRIWVQVSQPGVEVEDPNHDPSDPESLPDRWREPVAFDVFESDGRYLGRVTAPLDLSLYPNPVFDGDHVWAVTEDELDVQRIVRFRVVRGAAAADDG